jgi:hypothetical protein
MPQTKPVKLRDLAKNVVDEVARESHGTIPVNPDEDPAGWVLSALEIELRRIAANAAIELIGAWWDTLG